jgi:hypothetical protein
MDKRENAVLYAYNSLILLHTNKCKTLDLFSLIS